jgi:hypothetical protein
MVDRKYAYMQKHHYFQEVMPSVLNAVKQQDMAGLIRFYPKTD